MFLDLANMALLFVVLFCLKSITTDHVHFMSYYYIIYIPAIHVYIIVLMCYLNKF